MRAQSKKLNVGAKLRRLMLAVFALCFFVSVALLGGFGVVGTGGEGAGVKLAGDTQEGKTTYDAVGDGLSADTAWLIGNAAQLKDLADKVNGVDSYAGAADNLYGKYIRLTADIDLSGFGATFNGGAGYDFVGWYTDAGFSAGSKVTDVAIAQGSTGDEEFWTKWSAEYKITYNLDGGTNAANPTAYTQESAAIMLADPSRAGYDFVGWYTDAGFSAGSKVTGVAIASGSTGDKEFWAKWSASAINAPDLGDLTVILLIVFDTLLLLAAISIVRKAIRKRAAAAKAAALLPPVPEIPKAPKPKMPKAGELTKQLLEIWQGVASYTPPNLYEQPQNPYGGQNPYGAQNPYDKQPPGF